MFATCSRRSTSGMAIAAATSPPILRMTGISSPISMALISAMFINWILEESTALLRRAPLHVGQTWSFKYGHEGDVHGAVAEAHLHLLRLAVQQQLHLGAGELRHLLVLVEEAGRSIGADLPRREERHLHRPFRERLQTIEKIRRRFLFFVYFSPNPAS